MSYTALYRKFRPQQFEDVKGQDHIVTTLKNQIRADRIGHAYLFCGTRGTGKTTVAKIFARAVNCEDPVDGSPCGQCPTCQGIAAGTSMNVIEIDAASNNGVDDIKTLMDQVQIPPQVGKYSVYIIDEVHMLSQSAFNAFLKTLEEPPAHAIFILCTTEKHKIIPTILSRCQTYDFNRISVPDIVMNLRSIATRESINIDDESLHVIARKADGAMRDALTIFDQTVAFCGSDVHYEDVIRNLNVLDYEYNFKIVDAALHSDYKSAFLLLDEVLSKGFNAQYFISSVGEHLRDLLVSRTAGMEGLLDFPDSLRRRYVEQAEQCSVKFIYDALAVTTACEAGYRAAVNQRLHIEFALMKLCFLSSAPAEQKAAAQPVPQPAAQPAPTQQPVAAPQPAAPRARRTAAAASLSSLINPDARASESVEKGTGEGPVPQDGEIAQGWQKLGASFASRPRLASAILNAKTSIREEDGMKILTFLVVSDAQCQWIRANMLSQMESEFRKILGSGKVGIEVDVLPHEQQAPPIYLDEDKARKSMAENPEVANLVKDLQLDA